MPTNPLRLKHIRNISSNKGAAKSPGKPGPTGVPHHERHDYCQHNHPDKVYLGKMTEKKRQSALDIKKREEIRANKQKLIQILFQKLTNKFRRAPKSVIKKIVYQFVSKKDQIKANDLQELENRVREFFINSRKDAEAGGGNLPDVNSAPEDDENKAGNLFSQPASARRAKCTCEGCVSGGTCEVLPQGHEWEALNLFQSYQAGIIEKREQDEKKKKQRELREALDAQMREAKSRERNKKYEDVEHLQYMNRDLKKFNDENQAKFDLQNAKYARERSFWEKQMSEDNAMRRKEQDKMIRQEQSDLRRMEKQVAEEKRKLQEKKDKEAEMHRVILEENARNKIAHQERSKLERDEDNRIMKEYADRLDKEEKRRQDAFAKRMSDLEKIVKMADDGPVGKGRRDDEKREEELLLKQQLAREQAEANREKSDLQAKIERDRAMNEHNKMLLERQEEAKKAAKEMDKIYTERYERLGKEFKEENNRKKREEVEKCARQRQLLLDQMKAKQQAKDEMNAVERSINYETIHNIRKDLNFQGRLQHRIRMARHSPRPTTPGSARGEPQSKNNGWM